MWAYKNKKGFTIVELLIVVVVVGILAAISLVSFNNVQVRAKNSSSVSSVKGMVDMLSAYAVENTVLRANTVTKENLCLGSPSEYPAATGFGAGECRSDDGFAEWKADSNFVNELDKVGRASGATSVVKATDGRLYRGIWYDDASQTDSLIYYALQGTSQSCGIPGTTAVSSSGITICSLRIGVRIEYLVP